MSYGTFGMPFDGVENVQPQANRNNVQLLQIYDNRIHTHAERCTQHRRYMCPGEWREHLVFTGIKHETLECIALNKLISEIGSKVDDNFVT